MAYTLWRDGLSSNASLVAMFFLIFLTVGSFFFANFERPVLGGGGGGGGRPDYLQKLKVPEGYEKMSDYSNI